MTDYFNNEEMVNEGYCSMFQKISLKTWEFFNSIKKGGMVKMCKKL